MISDPIRIGAVGLGRGFMLTLPSLVADPHVTLAACSSSRQVSRDLFERQFEATAYESLGDMLQSAEVEAVYIATPHEYHARDAVLCAEAGKHVLVDKPLAIELRDAQLIVDAAERCGVHLITGPSHSFDHGVELAAKIVASGEFGQVRMVNAQNYTDFLYRPRRPEELQTAQGGGVMFSQAVHQIDVVRRIVNRPVESVFGRTGNWDSSRDTEGSFQALLNFEGGAFATLCYSGYAHYDSDEQQNWITELGSSKDPAAYGKSRKLLATLARPEHEPSLKAERGFGAAPIPEVSQYPEHFGPLIVSCDGADLRVYPHGVEVWADYERKFIPVEKFVSPRSTVFKGLYQAIRQGLPPVQSGRWGLDSLAICHAIMDSEKSRQVILTMNNN